MKNSRTVEAAAQNASRWLPPIAGAVFAATAIASEVGRVNIIEKSVVFTLFGVAIGLAGRWPGIALGAVTAIPGLQIIGVLYPPSAVTWPTYIAIGIVGLFAGFWGSGWTARLALPTGLLASALAAYRMVTESWQEGLWGSWTGSWLMYREHPVVEDFVMLSLVGFGVFAGLWAFGAAAGGVVRNRSISGVLRAAESRLEETDFELRLSEDRARISRDVHDALAHSLAVIVSQAEGAMALKASRPKVAGEALKNIATVGRTSLVDVRSLVERIHGDDVTAAKPTIADLDELVHSLREIGMDVTKQVLGTPGPLSATHELAVFRIVQESLTNALKHGGAPVAATVTLDWQGPGLAILVTSRGSNPTEGDHRGIGIAGMRERARLAGGWLTAEPADDGSFIVTAFVPASPAIEHRELADA